MDPLYGLNGDLPSFPVQWSQLLAQQDGIPGSVAAAREAAEWHASGAKGSGPRVFCGHVPKEVSEELVKTHFSCWGTVTDVYFPRHKKTLKRRPFCFVTFSRTADAERAVAESQLAICGIPIKSLTMVEDRNRYYQNKHFSAQAALARALRTGEEVASPAYGSYGAGLAGGPARAREDSASSPPSAEANLQALATLAQSGVDIQTLAALAASGADLRAIASLFAAQARLGVASAPQDGIAATLATALQQQQHAQAQAAQQAQAQAAQQQQAQGLQGQLPVLAGILPSVGAQLADSHAAELAAARARVQAQAQAQAQAHAAATVLGQQEDAQGLSLRSLGLALDDVAALVRAPKDQQLAGSGVGTGSGAGAGRLRALASSPASAGPTESPRGDAQGSRSSREQTPVSSRGPAPPADSGSPTLQTGSRRGSPTASVPARRSPPLPPRAPLTAAPASAVAAHGPFAAPAYDGAAQMLAPHEAAAQFLAPHDAATAVSALAAAPSPRAVSPSTMLGVSGNLEGSMSLCSLPSSQLSWRNSAGATAFGVPAQSYGIGNFTLSNLQTMHSFRPQ